MTQVVRKAFFDFEKEEKFLNEMSKSGLALTNYTWCKYVFEDAPKGEYIYRLELLKHPINHPESQAYIQFMKDTGAELVTNYNRWAYFRKRTTDGEFNIYSDLDSRIQHYKRIRILFLMIAVLNLFIGILNWVQGNVASSINTVPINTYVSILSLSVTALVLIFLILPLTRKIDTLEKEKVIRE